jgi:hypothetical protein
MRGRRRLRWRVGFWATLLCVAAVGVSYLVARADLTRPPVTQAATNLAGWHGAAYRGAIAGPDNVVTAVELTVTADGAAHGVLARDFGARAEFAVDGPETLVKGNRQWWLYERPTAADQLADRWVANPPSSPVPVEALTPAALAGQLSNPPDAVWTETGDRAVDGRPGRVFSDGARYAVVTASAPHRLLSVELPLAVQLPPVPRAFVAQDDPELTDSRKWRASFQISEPDSDELTRVRAATNTIKKSVSTPPQPIDQLTAQPSNVTPDLADRLARRGIDPTAAAGAGVYGQPMLEALDALTNRGVDAQEATRMLDMAARSRVFAALHQVVVSGKLHNPGDLNAFMRGAKRPGSDRHLEEAAHRTEAGHEVVLDGKYSPANGAPGQNPEAYKADILDLTAKEAVQVKTLTTDKPGQIIQEYDKAADQLAGNTREVPPPDFARVVQMQFEIGSFGKLADGSRDEVQRTLQSIAGNNGRSYSRNGTVTKVVVTNYAGMTPSSPRATRYEFTPQELDPPSRPGGSAPLPAPNGPPPAPAAAPAPRPLFGTPGTGSSSGPLVDLARQRPSVLPGGIDFTSLELRYLADTGSEKDPAMQYAFSAKPAAAGGEHREVGLRAAEQASDAFFVWLSLPRSAFWVNLNPDQPDRITDAQLGRTDVGRILLEADLELKKTRGRLIHPDTPLGAQYWESVYSAGLSSYCLSFRVWIAPGPAKIYEEHDAIHILDAPLVVQVAHQEVRTRPAGCKAPPTDIADQQEDLERRLVLPQLQQAVNEAPEYAGLRQVYLSRVAAEWYRQRSEHQPTGFSNLVDDGDINRWVSADPWSPTDVFDRYRTSYLQGEYTAQHRGRNGIANVSVGGVDFHAVELTRVGTDELRTAWSGVADTVDKAFDHPTQGKDGRFWLGSTTAPSGLVLPPPPVLYGAAAVIAALWLRYRWWRRKRRRARAQSRRARPERQRHLAVPSDAAVAERLARLRQEARRG